MRDLYLEVARVTAGLVAHASVAENWDEDSTLPDFAVSGLAGHLARSILQVEWYLDADLPDAELITASQYYAALVGVTDPNSELNGAYASGATKPPWAVPALWPNAPPRHWRDSAPGCRPSRSTAASGLLDACCCWTST